MASRKIKVPAKVKKTPIPTSNIGQIAKQLIYEVRGQKVILDADVAEFYGRTTGHVNQQRSRNQDRFPSTYAFQLTQEEWTHLKSQNVISSSHGGRRTRPWAYTEHGFTMLSTRLSGEKAAHISQIIIDTFVAYRRGSLPAERTLIGPHASKRRQQLQDTIYKQMDLLLKLDLPTGETVASELKSITSSAIGRVKAVLDAPAKKNEHISAEIKKLEAETAKLYAEAQKTNAESASIWADVYQKRLNMLGQLREMAVQLERDDVMDVIDVSFGEDQAPALPSPKKK